MSHEENVRRGKKLFSGIRHQERQLGYTGTYAPGGGLYKDPAYDLPAGLIWVRIGDGRGAVPVQNTNGIAPLDIVNVPVYIAFNLDLQANEVVAVDWVRARGIFGDAVYQATQTRHTHPSRDIENGRVYLAEAGTLKFRAKPFFYKDSAGDRKWWPDVLGSHVTASVTAASGEHQLIVLALNPDATTPVLTATNSTPVGASVSLTREDAAAVALTDGYKPLAALHVYNGDATPRGEDHIWDLREWLEGSGGGGTASPLIAKGDLYTFDTDNTRLPVGSEGQYLRARDAEPTGLKWESVAVGNGLTVTKATRLTTTVLYHNVLASSGIFDVDLSAIAAASGCDAVEIYAGVRSTASGTNDQLRLYFNNDTTDSNYKTVYQFGGSSEGATVSDSPRIGDVVASGGTSGYLGRVFVRIDRFGVTGDKTAVASVGSRRNATDFFNFYADTHWENTAAITRIALQPDGYATDSFAAGSWLTIVGFKEEDIVTDVVGGMAEYSEGDVSNPPTAAELDSAFGTPAALGAGFVGLVNDGGADTTVWLAMSTGTKWFYASMTEAT